MIDWTYATGMDDAGQHCVIWC